MDISFEDYEADAVEGYTNDQAKRDRCSELLVLEFRYGHELVIRQNLGFKPSFCSR